MRKISLALAIVLAPFAAYSADLRGKWLTDEGKGHVLFEQCGPKLCGKIVWLKEPNDPSGMPQVDALNEDQSLRTRPVLGIRLTELESDGNGGWKGVIYNPEDGKSYQAKAKIKENGTLLVEGCMLGGFLCDDQTWTRVN
ncbi:MAG: DUF2147 domain-containing protein [Rhodomicrobium sp.]